MDKIHKQFFLASLDSIQHQVDALKAMISAVSNDIQHTPKTKVVDPELNTTSWDFDKALGEQFERLARDVEVVDGDKL